MQTLQTLTEQNISLSQELEAILEEFFVGFNVDFSAQPKSSRFCTHQHRAELVTEYGQEFNLVWTGQYLFTIHDPEPEVDFLAHVWLGGDIDEFKKIDSLVLTRSLLKAESAGFVLITNDPF